MTDTKNTCPKIPETSLSEWTLYTVRDGSGAMVGSWSGPMTCLAQKGMVVRMKIQAAEDGSARESRLHLYTEWDTDATVRIVDLGVCDRVEDAVLKVVRLGAKEAGRVEKQPMQVYIHYSGTEMGRIEEISPKVAESVAELALSDGDPEFFETLKDLGDHDYDGSICAIPLMEDTLPL
ncbi:MAG: hypothetical protein OXI16_13805 [Chloroflexota bacterium]|nr:hypothetical protein [Chloroflexota bacterium]